MNLILPDFDRLADEPQPASIYTKTGWQEYLRLAPPTRPPQLTPDQWAKLVAGGKTDAYNAARLSYHNSLTSIPTKPFTDCFNGLTGKLNSVSQHALCARGVMVSGDAHSGKTTTVLTWARQVEVSLRSKRGIPLHPVGEPALRLPGTQGGEYLPVAVASVADSVGGTLRNVLAFYDDANHRRSRADLARLTEMIANNVHASGTRVVILDQVHDVPHSAHGAKQTSEMLKGLMDRCRGTLFVGVGVAVEKTGILADGTEPGEENLAQTGARFPIIGMPSIRPTGELHTTLARFEMLLVLRDAHRGDVTGLEPYITRRTRNGSTGAVMQLIRDGANEAITSGEERITERVLDRVDISAITDLESGHTTAVGKSDTARNPALTAAQPGGKPRPTRAARKAAAGAAQKRGAA